MNNNKFVIYAANDGGHFSQLMSLSPLFSKYRSIVVTDNIRANKKMPELQAVENIEYTMAYVERRKELAGCNKKTTHFDYLIAYAKLFFQCYRVIKKYKPMVIISTGSNIAVPLFIWGKILGSKLIFIETRAKVYSKTLTGRIVSKISNMVIVQWPEMLNVYNNAKYWGTLV